MSKRRGTWTYVKRAYQFVGGRKAVGAALLTLVLGWISNGFGIPSLVSKYLDARNKAVEKQGETNAEIRKLVAEISGRRALAKQRLRAERPNKAISILNGKDADGVIDPAYFDEPLVGLIQRLTELNHRWGKVDLVKLTTLAQLSNPSDLPELIGLLDQAFPERNG